MQQDGKDFGPPEVLPVDGVEPDQLAAVMENVFHGLVVGVDPYLTLMNQLEPQARPVQKAPERAPQPANDGDTDEDSADQSADHAKDQQRGDDGRRQHSEPQSPPD